MVKRTSNEPEAVDLNPAGYWAFFFSLSLYLTWTGHTTSVVCPVLKRVSGATFLIFPDEAAKLIKKRGLKMLIEPI